MSDFSAFIISIIVMCGIVLCFHIAYTPAVSVEECMIACEEAGISEYRDYLCDCFRGRER